eukprot:TRINITY_DN3689_c0_g2_i4.p1 TRINITY_DN3689_c0_g2~~TRINITY_DN3689_c0_g2_i4.p1  ORF type:complete len:174 (+),score=27.29 TRINITY_DN3689_c0_g2_i4:263-784(+)
MVYTSEVIPFTLKISNLWSDYVCAQSRDFLRREGITHVVNCSPATCPNLFEDEFFYQNIDITDEASTDILVVMCLFVEAAEKILAEGGKIYVHCYQGISRAPSMILGFLIWREGTTLESALGSLREKYQKADPNLGFLLQLEYFAGRTRLSPASPDYKIPFFEPKMEMVSSSN